MAEAKVTKTAASKHYNASRLDSSQTPGEESVAVAFGVENGYCNRNGAIMGNRHEYA